MVGGFEGVLKSYLGGIGALDLLLNWSEMTFKGKCTDDIRTDKYFI